jgi:hypothetical protein
MKKIVYLVTAPTVFPLYAQTLSQMTILEVFQ